MYVVLTEYMHVCICECMCYIQYEYIQYVYIEYEYIVYVTIWLGKNEEIRM
jgi:hypothetical protein